MVIVVFVVGIVLGALAGAMFFRSRSQVSEAVLKTQLDTAQVQLNELKMQHEERVSELKAQHSQQMEEIRVRQQEQLEMQMNLLREQITTASERILKDRAEQLNVNNKEQLSAILDPLKAGIKQMQEAVEKTGKDSATTMERLDATIKTTLAQSKEIGERADKLAQALTGENKTQGNFGELRLKTILENMGLVEGEQYEEQVTMKDTDGKTIYEEEDGHRMIPDVILHFPDDRDVIIDSKMSLTAFEDYYNADTEAEKADALKRHIASVRKHADELSRKNYSKYIKTGRGRLDFVMMYVFSESALQLALANDTTLWKEAYDKGVIISGSQNLYMMLRVLEMTWKQVRQVENQENIMKCANDIVDRVQAFAERFAKVEEMLQKTQDAIDDVKKSTAVGGLSITTAASKLLKYGAEENPKRKKKLSSPQ